MHNHSPYSDNYVRALPIRCAFLTLIGFLLSFTSIYRFLSFASGAGLYIFEGNRIKKDTVSVKELLFITLTAA